MLCGTVSACKSVDALSSRWSLSDAGEGMVKRPQSPERTMVFRISRRMLHATLTRPTLRGAIGAIVLALSLGLFVARHGRELNSSVEQDVLSSLSADWRGVSMLAGRRAQPCDSLVSARPTVWCGTLHPTSPERLAEYSELAARTSRESQGAPSAPALRVLALLDVGVDPTGTAALTRAAAMLDDAVQAADVAVDVLIDHSAIHLQRFAVAHEVRDLILALEGATRALQLAPKRHEASWNRAVALTWAGMRQTAALEWQRYDTNAQGLSISQRPRVIDAAAEPLPDRLALDGHWRESTREYAWNVALPRLSGALLESTRDSGRTAVALVDTLAALSGRDGVDEDIGALRDDLMTASSRADTTRLLMLAVVLKRYTWVRSSAGRQVPAAASALIDSLLSVSRLPHTLSRWLSLERANQLMILGRSQEALQLFHRLSATAPHNASLYRVRADWGAAMSLASLGRTAESVARFAVIERECERLLLEDCRVGTAAMSAIYSSMLGDVDGTASAASRAVSALADAPLTQWHWTSAFLLRQVAELNRAPLAVDAFDEEAIGMATRLGRADLATAVVLERTRSAIEHSDSARAATLVRELRQRWMPLQSTEDQVWSGVNLLQFDAELIRKSRPLLSVALLDSTMRLTASDDNDARRTPLRLARAKSQLAAGDTVAALSELDDLLLRLRARGHGRVTVFDAARLARVLESVSQLSASVLRARGDASAALRALSGASFLRVNAAPCCADGSVASIAVRVVRDSAWIWMPTSGPGGWSLRVTALPARMVRAAIALDTGALADVYDRLIGPYRELSAIHDLCIDALGLPAQLPWSALRDRRRRQYLIERTRIRRVLDALGGCTVEQLAVGAERVVLLNASPPSGARALPAARREVANLQRLWGVGATVSDASVGSRRTLDAMSLATLVHFAGHAVLDRVHSDRSYLFLGSGADSMITGSAIATRRFTRAPLVILGACDAGGGSDGLFGGFDSLAGAFLGGGASRVIAASWPVDDLPTGQFMQLLHNSLRAGAPPAESLRLAQVMALQSKDPALNTPRVWAAFQIMGSERGGI